ncbi:NPCBM/NEW2 domain-containing protein [Nocardia paucivorans]|uniref:NPCBM/NEW2 domain-containing protein n=1 Tax=Nocardia paucivorans TaxID=114259 RepID=UPI000592DECB|nr:NPCBM/NEW2 domain-containing protein [Nocardia paucivorans]
MSNPTDSSRGPRPRPYSQTNGAEPRPRVGTAERRVLIVSGIGVAAALTGLTVTLLGGWATEDADSTTATPIAATLSEVSSPAPPPAAPPAPQPKSYLAEMTPSSGTPYTGTVAVNGVSYPHSVYQQFNGCNTQVSYTYNLNREWSQFSATAGIADGGDSQSVVQFEVYGDGSPIYSSGNVEVGETSAVNVPVTGVQNLTLSFQFVDGNLGLCTRVGNGVWGDAALSK